MINVKDMSDFLGSEHHKLFVYNLTNIFLSSTPIGIRAALYNAVRLS